MTRPSKIQADSVSHEEPFCGRRSPRSSSTCNHGKDWVRKRRYSIPKPAFDESHVRGSNCSRHSIDIRCQSSRHSPRQSVAVLESVTTNYWTALDYYSYRLSDRSQNFPDDVESHISKMARRPEVQLKEWMLDGSDPIGILGFLPTLQKACNTIQIYKGLAMLLSRFL